MLVMYVRYLIVSYVLMTFGVGVLLYLMASVIVSSLCRFGGICVMQVRNEHDGTVNQLVIIIMSAD